MRVSRNFLLVIGAALILSSTLPVNSQQVESCIIEQPIPELPKDHGLLDAITSVMFRLEFRADGTIGTVQLIHSTHFKNLDALAEEAARKITFLPQHVTTYRVVQYQYSWRFPGWKVARFGKYCTIQPVAVPKPSSTHR